MSEDSELERLKAKRLAEMQKNINTRQDSEKTTEQTTQAPPENPRDILVKVLGYRGMEVLQNAESQFPNETTMIVQKLSELIKSGELNETLDGGKLLALFRTVGLNIRMETKINVEQDGKFVSLTDKLSKESKDDE
ncbi:MAG: double-stranded DNA-binding protein [Nitrosopumilus sp.]|nr:MAG: double-stranded DNA-binding protein [Nitrosopumilus sp.]